MKLLTYIITGIYFIFTIIIFLLKKDKITVKKIALVGIFSSIAIVLNIFLYIPFIWGSRITFGSLAIMLSGIIIGPTYGMLTGIITILGYILIEGWVFIHPMQLFTEYYLCFTALGLLGLFNISKKGIIIGALICGSLAIMGHFLTGVIFYGEFAPSGMNVYLYSISYNLISEGSGILISTIVILYMPIIEFKRMVGVEYNE